MGVVLNVQIISASDVGGVYPFVVVCFDGDIDNEIYKTEAAVGGQTATWNHSFQLDLTTNVKAITAANRPKPTYLTFFLFDTGTPGVPSLGSAGVLLSTVHERGRAQGDFPIVNGSGTLRLVVASEKTKAGRFGFGGGTGDPEEDDEKFGSAAKVAGITAGVAALSAAGIGYAVHHNKKKKEKEGEGENPEKKKKSWLGRLRGNGSSSEEEEDHAEHDDQEQEERDLLQEGRDIQSTGGDEDPHWDDIRRDEDRDDHEGRRDDLNDRDDDDDGDANDEPDDNIHLPHDARDDYEHEPVAIPFSEDPPEIPPVSFGNSGHEFDGTDSDGQAFPTFESFDGAHRDDWGPSDDSNHDDFVDDPADFDYDESFD